jgi:hypothetical protein
MEERGDGWGKRGREGTEQDRRERVSRGSGFDLLVYPSMLAGYYEQRHA